MKLKTVRKTIREKIDTFIRSIKDEKLRDLLKRDIIVTGGCIVSLLQGEEPNDFDIYFKTAETTKAVAEYYVNRNAPDDVEVGVLENEESQEIERVSIFIKSKGYLEFKHSEDKEKFEPKFITDNAITLTDDIQLILRFFGSPEDIHKNYDFMHCTGFWEASTDRLEISKEALISIITKELRYVGSKYPVCSLARIRKFIKRGWSINAGQLLKIILQVNALNLKDIDVLRDQLLGVDTTYFVWFLQELEEARKNREIDDTYVAELLDKVFDGDKSGQAEPDEEF